MDLDQLLRDSAPDTSEMHRNAERMRSDVVARFAAAPEARPHSRRRWATGLAVAAAAATAFIVASPGGPATSPAFAVTQEADGDVVATIHELEDAAGLGEALRAAGIDAQVNFQVLDNLPTPPPGAWNGPVVGEEVRDALALDGSGPNCLRAATASSVSFTQQGDDWVLRIPADSILQDVPVYFTTQHPGPQDLGHLHFFFANDKPGGVCAGLADDDLPPGVTV